MQTICITAPPLVILSLGLALREVFFMISGIGKGLAVLVLLTGMIGCGTGADTKPKIQSYPQDGYMGMTSVNPNNPLHPTYHHYQDDSNLMRAVLAQIPGITDSHIRIQDPHVDVRLKLSNQLTKEQAEEIRSTAQMALDTNMPRYHVDVAIAD
jgi:hypothetical protein